MCLVADIIAFETVLIDLAANEASASLLVYRRRADAIDIDDANVFVSNLY